MLYIFEIKKTDTELIKVHGTPVTVFLPPADMDDNSCNLLFHKAIENTNVKNCRNQNVLETIHRKTIRYVSEVSLYVGYKSDYIEFTPLKNY